MTVEMGTRSGEAGDVICEAMIRIVKTSIKIGDTIVGLIGHVSSIGLLSQTTSECHCNFGLEKTKL